MSIHVSIQIPIHLFIHTMLKGDAFNFNTVEFGGSTWYLHDVTFHRKSETRVNGRQFDLEAQLLHVEPKEGKMLVVSTLFQVSKTPNNLLWAFDWTNLPKTAGQGTGLSPDIDLMQLLPGWLAFWHYEGSLTVPPCSEGVQWIVMKNPLGISQEQLDFFPFSSNFRPPQPLNGRVLLRQQTFTTEYSQRSQESHHGSNAACWLAGTWRTLLELSSGKSAWSVKLCIDLLCFFLLSLSLQTLLPSLLGRRTSWTVLFAPLLHRDRRRDLLPRTVLSHIKLVNETIAP